MRREGGGREEGERQEGGGREEGGREEGQSSEEAIIVLSSVLEKKKQCGKFLE